jgi:hypothetical protein
MSDLELALWICGGLIVLWILIKLCKNGKGGGVIDVIGDIFD